MNGVLSSPPRKFSITQPTGRQSGDGPAQETEQVTVVLEEGFATNRVNVTESDWQESDVNNTEPASSHPADRQPFWGLQRSIPDIEKQLGRVQGKRPSLTPTQDQQLRRDVDVYRDRIREDRVRDMTRTQRHDEISQQNQRARMAADTTNKLLFNGNRDLNFISNDKFDHLDYGQHKDTYFITVEHQTPVLRYIDQQGTPGLITIHEVPKRQQLAEKIQEKLQHADNRDVVTLDHDEFTRLITDGSTTNNDPATGHYNTSLAAQNLKSERIREAEFTTYRNTIARRFREREAGAAKANWLIHQESRNFYIRDAADVQHIDLKAMEGDYILYRDLETAPYPYKLFLVENGALHPIPVPASSQTSFNEMISDREQQTLLISPDQTPQFTLNQEEFESVIGHHTMHGDLPETAHFNSSRANQQRREDLIRSRYFQYRWDQIGKTLQAATKAANKTNALQSSGARTIQVVAQQGRTAINPAEHPDEYFIEQYGRGHERRFLLHYIDLSGKIGEVRIHNEKAFNSRLQRLISESNPPATIELDHQDFVDTVTKNSYIRAPGDWLQDRYVEDAHFSTSVEAQRLKSTRMEDVTGSIIARAAAENFKKLDAAISSHWGNREYGTAISKRINYVISEVCMTVVDGSAELLGDLSRAVTESGEDVVSAIARSARTAAPYLAAGSSYIGYGLERGANLIGRMCYVPAEYICSQFARAARWVAPDLHYFKDRVGYGMSRLGDKFTRTISGAGSALCQQLARAFRWAAPYFSEPASWARFYLDNAVEDASLAITRAWYDKSMIQYVIRSGAEKTLFRDTDPNSTTALSSTGFPIGRSPSFRL